MTKLDTATDLCLSALSATGCPKVSRMNSPVDALTISFMSSLLKEASL